MKIRMIWGVPRFQGTEMGRLMPVAADLQEASWGLRCQQECRTRTSRPARHPARLEKYLWFLPRKRCPSPKQNAEFIVKNWCVTVVSSVEVGWSWDVASKDWDPSTKVTKQRLQRERIELAMVATPKCVGWPVCLFVAPNDCLISWDFQGQMKRLSHRFTYVLETPETDIKSLHQMRSNQRPAWVALLLPFAPQCITSTFSIFQLGIDLQKWGWPADQPMNWGPNLAKHWMRHVDFHQ